MWLFNKQSLVHQSEAPSSDLDQKLVIGKRRETLWETFRGGRYLGCGMDSVCRDSSGIYVSYVSYVSRGPTSSSVGPVLPFGLMLWSLHPCSLVFKESLLVTLQSFINMFSACVSHCCFLLFAPHLYYWSDSKIKISVSNLGIHK